MATVTEYPVLYDEEARPSPPHPYCTYTVDFFTTLHRSGGSSYAHTEHHVERAIITFRVHVMGNTRESAKARAIRLADAVTNVFDNATLDLYPNKQVTLTRQNPVGVREGEEEWMWMIPYELVYDKVISRRVRRSIER